MHICGCNCGCHKHSKNNNNYNVKTNINIPAHLLNRTENFYGLTKTNSQVAVLNQNIQTTNIMQQLKLVVLTNPVGDFLANLKVNFGILSEKIASFFFENIKTLPKEKKLEKQKNENEILKVKPSESSNFNEEEQQDSQKNNQEQDEENSEN